MILNSLRHPPAMIFVSRGVRSEQTLMARINANLVNLGYSTSLLLVLLLSLTGCHEKQSPSSTLETTMEKVRIEQISELRDRAERGDVMAQYTLGDKASTGQGVPQDFTEAAKWFRKAAGQAYAPAQYTIGMLLINGHVKPNQEGEAARW